MDSLELRKNLAGLIARDTTGAPRDGVFPRHSNALVTATASTGPMTVNVAAFEAALVRQGGPLWMQNDGTVAVSIATAPVANSRIDVVYARQNESAAPMSDGSDTAVIDVVTGTPSGSPVKPSIPVGALELATVVVPTGVTATTGGGVVITQTYACTASSGGVVRLRNQAEQDAWSPADGSLGWRLDTGALLNRVSGVWRVVAGSSDTRNRAVGTTNTFTNPTTPSDFTQTADKDALDMTFVKHSAGTTLRVSMQIPFVFSSGAAQVLSAVINIAGTDYVVAAQVVPTAPFYGTLTAVRDITGVAAGSTAIKPRVQSQSAASVAVNATTRVSYRVDEI
ncbi:hypothetical protein [Agromyces sp. CF514]|uniref:hypothetical protein n=1 Tax=Agromyces sp. CF514 TaxID=1881031 RepID=UPI0011609D9B|nr:hypothetical protein [Agromyces sp. CF514]